MPRHLAATTAQSHFTVLNILHFSTSDLHGGAAKAAYRLHTSLRQAGHSSQMIVRDRLSGDPTVLGVSRRPIVMLARKGISRLVPRFKWCHQHDFNPDLVPPVQLAKAKAKIDRPIDILCLHWITGLLSARGIAELAREFSCPVVWMLTDQEPYTGGCHYAYECTGYRTQCGACPQLKSRSPLDRSRVVWKRKSQHLMPLPITFVSSCRWTSECFREASLFRSHRLEDIGDALDTDVFRPVDKHIARTHLRIPAESKVIFFGAFSLENPRKGMNYLREAFVQLAARLDDFKHNVFILCAGHNPDPVLAGLPFQSRSLGYLKRDLDLAVAYQAADIFVCPSIYEAGAMMIPEAMLCGTPVVAFDTGNAPDLIRTMANGYRAIYKDSADLARGIVALLRATDLGAIGGVAHRSASERHSPTLVASRHTVLYKALMSETTRRTKDDDAT